MTRQYNYESLKRHNVSVDEIGEVLRCLLTVNINMGPSRAGNDRIMWIGFTYNARLLEIGMEYLPEGTEYVFHANNATDLAQQAFDKRRKR